MRKVISCFIVIVALGSVALLTSASWLVPLVVAPAMGIPPGVSDASERQAASSRQTTRYDLSRVTLLESRYTVERGIDNVGIIWVTGRLQHTFDHPVMIKIETTVYDNGGQFLGTYSWLVNDPVPPQTPRGFRNLALGYNLPAGTSVGRVDVHVINVSTPWR